MDVHVSGDNLVISNEVDKAKLPIGKLKGVEIAKNENHPTLPWKVTVRTYSVSHSWDERTFESAVAVRDFIERVMIK